MPCECHYPTPSKEQSLNQRTAKLILWLLEKHGKRTAQPVSVVNVQKAATDMYCRDESLVPFLCAEIERMTPEDLDRIVYNARDPMSRRLADWWEEHLAADREREEREKSHAEAEHLRRKGLAKLTPREQEALGLR